MSSANQTEDRSIASASGPPDATAVSADPVAPQNAPTFSGFIESGAPEDVQNAVAAEPEIAPEPLGANPVSTTITVQAAAGDATFNLELDATAASLAPPSYIDGWRTAANLLSAAIPINITINLEVGYGEYPKSNQPLTGGNELGGPENGLPVSYQQLRNLLLSNGSSAVVAAVNDLPNTTSLNGVTQFYIAPAEAKVWGQISPNNSAIDGYAGFSANIDPSEIVGGALHEFTHAMGRVPGLSVLSLFRYTSPGQHDTDQNLPTGPSYFSIDGGNTELADFGEGIVRNGQWEGDPSDFLNPPDVNQANPAQSNRTPNDPFNEFYSLSTTQSLTPLDKTVLAMLGFSGARAPGDDYANSLTDTTHPFGQVSVGGSATGTLEVAGDRDWFSIPLSAGVTYTINLMGQHSAGGTLADPYLRLHDNTGALLSQDDDIVSGVNLDSQIGYQAAYTGTYYIEAGAHNDALTGTYTVSAAATSIPDDYANSLTDTSHPFGQISVGGSATGTLEVAGDRDWFRIQLSAGVNYTINLDGVQSGLGTLADPYLRLHSSTGALLAENDDIVTGVDRDSQLIYDPTTTGTYYIEAGAYADQYTGTYRISVDTGLVNTVEPSGGVFTSHGSTAFAGSQSVTSWTGTASASIANSDAWTGLAGSMAEEIAFSSNLNGSSSVFTDPVLLGLGAPTGQGGLAITGSGPATAAETISYAFSAPVAAGNSFILWAPGALYNSETGPFTFTVSASLGNSQLQTSGWSFDVRSPFGTALPGTFTVNSQTGTVTVNNYTNNPFAAVIVTPNTALDHIAVVANTIENDLWGFAFSNNVTTASPVAPVNISSVSASVSNVNLGAGAAMTITLTMSGQVIVTGTPTLSLNSGGIATYDQGKSTNTSLVFDYTVGAGQNAATLAVTAVNGSITNTGGIAINSNLPSSATLSGLQVDTTTPTLTDDGSITLAAGTTAPIPASQLTFTDNLSSHAQETYSIITAPAAGVLLKGASATSSFTQADIDNGLISYRETLTGAAADSFTFRVTDAAVNQTPTETFQIHILNGPKLTSQTPNPTWTANQPISLVLPVNTFTDPQGEALLYTVSALPSWLNFNSNTRTFSGTAPTTLTSLPITVTASDTSNLAASETFTATVSAQAPVLAIPGQSQAWIQGRQVSLSLPSGTFTDPQNETLSYIATLAGGATLPSWLSFNPGTATFSGTVPANTPSLSLTVTATDQSGLSTPDTFTAVVQVPAPTGLVLSAASDSGAKGDNTTVVRTPTIIGFGEAGETVTLRDGTTAVGSGVVAPNGTWSIASNRLGLGAHTLTAIETDTNGSVSLASAPLSLSIVSSAANGDFNGDSTSDILWHDDSGQNLIWNLTGSQKVGGAGLPTTTSDWHIAGLGDFNDNGTADILWHDDSGQNLIWNIQNNQQISGAGLPTTTSDWHIAGLGDFNGDGTSDMLWHDDSGQNLIWNIQNDQQISGAGLPTTTSDWHIAGLGDFNGDGSSDILWHDDNGENLIWNIQNGHQIMGANLPTTTSDWHIAGLGDFNGDGSSDILWHNDNGQNLIWNIQNDQQIMGANLPTTTSDWHIAGIGDFNGDGSSDILWHNDNGQNLIWNIRNDQQVSGANLPTTTSDWHISVGV